MSLGPQNVVFEDKWAQLHDTMKKLVNEESSDISVMDFHETVYKICTARPMPLTDKLFERINRFLKDHVEKLSAEILNEDQNLLAAYSKRWAIYYAGAGYLHIVFRYFNAWAEKRQTEAGKANYADISSIPSPVLSLALKIWKEFCFDIVKDRLIKNVLAEIRKDRDGEDINSSVVLTVVTSFVTLCVEVKGSSSNSLEIYKSDFEKPFLADTIEYYHRESAAYIADHDVASYMIKAQEWLDQEETRMRKLLDPSSYSALIKTCETEVIAVHQEKLQAECQSLIEQERRDDLLRMYKLLCRVPNALEPMLLTFQQHITSVGVKEIEKLGETQQPAQYVESLLALHAKYTDIIRVCFMNDNHYIASLDKACRSIINDNSKSKLANKSPELLAAFCDQLLKKSNKNQSENEVEDKLAQVIKIFKYIEGKDIFQKFYSKFLAKRLIHGVSISDEAEGYMIGELKQVCGYDYTTKLQRMFTDISVSEGINKTFNEFRSNSDISLGLDFSVLVLQTGAWPLGGSANSPFNIPQELERCVRVFETFYRNKYTGRKLNWLHYLSKGDLRVKFGNRRYEVQCTNYQMAILLIYNTIDTCSYAELRQITSLNDPELKKTIKSLVDVKLISQQGGSGEITDETVFKVNVDFTSKRTKIKITTAVQAETPQEIAQTHKAVADDRSLYLQAAIVRIMKARKTLNHNQLVEEVITQLQSQFQPTIPMIKKSIEGLIDKQYLERVEGTRDKYNYLA